MTDLENYNQHLSDETEKLRQIAEQAKKRGEDPQPTVEIDQAEDIAERCEMLIREEIEGLDGLQEKIRHYEENTDLDREEISFAVSDDLVEGEIGTGLDERERVEAAVRTAIAILTEGVVAAPIEGIGEVTIEENDDGTNFIRIHYNGPIRSAGGTGQALSVLIADHVRQELGFEQFNPRDNEVQRYKEEIQLYDDDTGLQYMPKDKEIITIIENCPVMLDGMQTAEKEVSGYRDLERIDGNRPRGGVCLVAAEGLAQKAPKMKRIVDGNNIEGWGWLEKLSTVTTTDDKDEDQEEKESEEDTEEQGEEQIDYSQERTTDFIDPNSLEHPVFEPTKKFQKDITGGRPIFSGPSRRGGFRLRYGRGRNTGIASSGFHPAAMIATDEFLGTGVQQKTERPGKATGTAPVDGIEGPTVRLEDGTVKQLTSEEEARTHENEIEYIIDIGEILLNYGEFLENNHPLAPSPYTLEWWIQDLEHAGMPTNNLNPDKVNFDTTLKMSDQWDIPIHPNHTYLFSDISADEYAKLAEYIQHAEEVPSDYEYDDTYDYTFTVNKPTRDTLEHLLVEHKQEPLTEDDNTNNPSENTSFKIYISQTDYERLDYYLDPTLDPHKQNLETGIECVNHTIDHTMMPRVTTRIGSRMGRPEKSDIRSMSPPIHGLFPVGDKGGKGRNLYKAANNTEGGNRNVETGRASDEYRGQGIANVQLNNRICTNCNSTTWHVQCPQCNRRTDKIAQCYNCGNIKRPDKEDDKCTSCYNGKFKLATRQQLNINKEVEQALDTLGEQKSRLPKTKGVEGLTSVSKVPEPIEKTILRGKYDVYPFRDSTVRYDMVDLPLTSFKVEEVIGLDFETAKRLGYEHTLKGEPLEDESQLIEIFPQDIIISEDAGEYMLQTANYIDQLLEDYYGVDPYYEAESKEDLIGELVIGLAPHTSAGVSARIIGFSNSKAQLGHPVFHAAKRRNCFHPDTELSYKLNGEWKRSTIEELVETHLTENADSDEYITDEVVQSVEDHPDIEELKVPSMTDEGHRTLENVTHLSKHPPTDHLIQITTDDGSEIKVTGDHKIPVKASEESDQLMVRKKAHQIEQGDELFDYNEDLLEEARDFQEIDMLEELLTRDHDTDLENVMIRGMSKEQVYDLLIPEVKPTVDGRFYKMKHSCEYLDIPKKSLDNYLRRESIPISLFQDLYTDRENTIEAILENIPRNIELGMNSDSVSTPRVITLDEEIATLIGYYTAEGFTREKMDDRVDGEHRGSTHTDFAATETQAREFIIQTLEKKFNVDNPYTNEKRITASGNMIRFFFQDVLDSGKYAHTKEIPTQIQNASDRVKRRYLSGYISGDGYVRKDNGSVGAVTVSEQLKDELVELLTELGYKGSIRCYEEEPVLLREKFPEYYDDDYEGVSKRTYNIRLLADAGKELVSEGGIQLKRKETITTQKYNTKTVTSIKNVSNSEHLYDVTIPTTHKLEANITVSYQCDGDEDAIFLALDGFLNFSREYLPDAIGRRSVTRDTEVYIKDVDRTEQKLRIDELFNKYSDTTTVENRGDGWEVVELPGGIHGTKVIAFDRDTGNVKYQLATKVMRHPNDKDVYEITTEKNGSIKMTGDHGIFVYKDGEITDYDARDLSEGDNVVVPSDLSFSLTTDAKEVTRIKEDIGYETVTSIEQIDYDGYVYDLEVPFNQNFLCGSNIFAHNTMDAPLVVTSVIDPTEIDDEAHMVDVVPQYGRDFYLKSWEMPGPKEVDIEIIEDMLGSEIRDVQHTIETSDINAGPYSSRYPKLEGMQNKVDRQLALAAKSRSVDEKTVASKVIDKHFFPDIRGNLRAYAQQDFRCTGCETKYRRLPLTGECPECTDGGNLIFTVHEGMIRKYMQPTLDIADKYEVDEYVHQQLKEIERELDSIFEMDTEEQTGLNDFM